MHSTKISFFSFFFFFLNELEQSVKRHVLVHILSTTFGVAKASVCFRGAATKRVKIKTNKDKYTAKKKTTKKVSALDYWPTATSTLFTWNTKRSVWPARSNMEDSFHQNITFSNWWSCIWPIDQKTNVSKMISCSASTAVLFWILIHFPTADVYIKKEMIYDLIIIICREVTEPPGGHKWDSYFLSCCYGQPLNKNIFRWSIYSLFFCALVANKNWASKRVIMTLILKDFYNKFKQS